MYNKKYNSTNKNLQIRDDLFCEFCNKQCKNLNSLKQHQVRCKLNPNAIKNTLSNNNWSKGLTKETDIRIKRQSESLKKYFKNNPGSFEGKHHTQEYKNMMSKIQTEIDHSDHNRNSHGKRGYYDSIFFMSTWELAFYIYIRDNFPDLQIKRCKKRFPYMWEHKKHYYTPDFIINDKFIEIKGWETKLDLVKYSVVDELVVIKQNEMSPILNYVKDTYNVDDISLLYEAG